MFRKLGTLWKSYKYRFVPWLAFNFHKRSVRSVEDAGRDRIIPKCDLLDQLQTLTSALHYAHIQTSSPSPEQYFSYQLGLQVMEETFGFHVYRTQSSLGGLGVVAMTHCSHHVAVQKGQLVALYPGAIYLPLQPIFFQSIKNPFIFRCIDGVMIDGHDKGLSKSIFKSCNSRDRVGPFPIADTSWLTDCPMNPLNVGQYINNQSAGRSSNVAYQEITIHPREVPIQERQYLPNSWYSPPQGVPVMDLPLRVVALVATRNILKGEELLSDYFTVIF